MSKQLTEKQRMQKVKQLERLHATIDKGKTRHTLLVPACAALGTSLVIAYKHGIIVGLVGFVISFLMMHLYFRSSWSNLNKTAKQLQKEILN